MLYAIVLGVHVVVCVLLILVVLLQSSKGGGLAGGSAFGGGAEMTMFGARGAATMLSKATTIFGAAFMVTSLALTLLGAGRSMRGPSSVVADEAARQPVGVPATETAPPVGSPTGDGVLPPSGGETAPAPSGQTAPAPAAGGDGASGGSAPTPEETSGP